MITLNINSKNLIEKIQQVITGAEELAKPSVMQEISKAVFTVTGERFVQAVDRFAVQNPKKMHHVYEWGGLGKPNARLFVIERTNILSGVLDINTNFLNSKLPVPIPSELQIPGSTGKFVTSKSIFKYKAQVMEDGRPVSIRANKILTFLGSEGQVFVQPGTIINIKNPGGIGTKNSFFNFMVEWYTQNADSVMDSSGMYERIVNDVSIALTAKPTLGVTGVRKVVKAVTDEYSKGITAIK